MYKRNEQSVYVRLCVGVGVREESNNQVSVRQCVGIDVRED